MRTSFIRSLLSVLLLSCIICGCSKKQTPTAQWYLENGKIKVLTTIAMIHDLVEKIGGEEVDSLPLICCDLDPHSYELVKGDGEKFKYADIIFYNGLGLEHGLSLRQHLEGNPKAIAVAQPILEESPEIILEVDGQYDPHVWMDIALWVRTIDPIVHALSQADPENAPLYHQRAEVLRNRMVEVDEKLYRKIQVIGSRKRYLVTSHDAFHYFAKHYLADPGEEDWKERCRAPEGLAPEAQMSVMDIIEIISHVETFKIGVLFPESNVSKDSLRKIVNAAGEKGFSIRLCHETLYGDSMGEASSYLDMITHNVEVIARELKK